VIPGARLIILGRQGAGKGTQCVRLSRHFVVPHISTGDILRGAVAEHTELGLAAKAIMDKGGLVGDDVMIGIVAERLQKPDTVTRGYILDGFPRTIPQADGLNALLAEIGQPLEAVVLMEVDRERLRDVVLKRLAARRVCNVCGTNFAATGLERQPWICDFCGGDVLQREDDTEEAINYRLDLYESNTSPLIDYYARTGLLVVVDGIGTPDAVLSRLVVAVENRQRRPR
jgi:adenylate kinase